MIDTKELTEVVYKELIKELEENKAIKEKEYEDLEKKRLKKYMLNDLASAMNTATDEEGYQKISEEVYPKLASLEKDIRFIELQLFYMEEMKRRYVK